MSLEAVNRQLAQLTKTLGGLVEEVQGMQDGAPTPNKPEPLRWNVTAHATESPVRTADGRPLPFFFAAGWGWPRAIEEGSRPEPTTHAVTDSGLAELRQWDGIRLVLQKVDPIDTEAARKAEDERRLGAALELAEALGMKLVSKDEPKVQPQLQPQQQRK